MDMGYNPLDKWKTEAMKKYIDTAYGLCKEIGVEIREFKNYNPEYDLIIGVTSDNDPIIYSHEKYIDSSPNVYVIWLCDLLHFPGQDIEKLKERLLNSKERVLNKNIFIAEHAEENLRKFKEKYDR